MTALVEVACPLCGADLYARPEEHPAPCRSCRTNEAPPAGTVAAREAEQRHASVRQAIADARAALHGAPAPTDDPRGVLANDR